MKNKFIDVKVDDVVSFWVYMGDKYTATGRFSDNALVYARVIKVGVTKIKVRTESGDIGWIYGDKFGLEIVKDEEIIEQTLERTKEAE